MQVLGWLSLLLLGACQGSSGTGVSVAAGSSLELSWTGPPGFVLNEAAPSELDLKGPGFLRQWKTPDLKAGRLLIDIPAVLAARELDLEGRIYLCQKTDARVCIQSHRSTRIRVGTAAGDQGRPEPVKLMWELKPGRN